MADELLFTVDGATAVAAQRISLAEAGLLERRHLQQWVVEHPELIGDGVKIVASEYGRWIAGATTPTADRLDVLGLDRTGRLIVVELKRDRAPDTVTMQAINYAAMVRRFNVDLLAEVHADHLGVGTTADQARTQLMEWAAGLSDETVNPPRIVLLASDFGPTVTNTVLFLHEYGIDIRLVRYRLYRIASGEKVLSVAQLLPVPDTEQFMVRPRSSAQSISRRGDRRTSVERPPAHPSGHRDDEPRPGGRRP